MFYLMYNLKNNSIEGISGSPFSDILDNCAVAEIKDEDAIDFIEGNKKFNDYCVLVSNGIVEFILKDIKSLKKRFTQNDNDSIVKDLDYKDLFFDLLKIDCSICNKKLILSLSQQANESLNFIKSQISMSKIKGTIYITKFMEPMSLIKKCPLNIEDFFNNKVFIIDLDSDEKISVWGSRENL